MINVLVDVFILEAYITEKNPTTNQETLKSIKNKYYNDIFIKHKVDSIGFYSTLYYLQTKPIEFDSILVKVDKKLNNIKALDTTRIVNKNQTITNLMPTNENDKLFNEQIKDNFKRKRKFKENNSQHTE